MALPSFLVTRYDPRLVRLLYSSLTSRPAADFSADGRGRAPHRPQVVSRKGLRHAPGSGRIFGIAPRNFPRGAAGQRAARESASQVTGPPAVGDSPPHGRCSAPRGGAAQQAPLARWGAWYSGSGRGAGQQAPLARWGTWYSGSGRGAGGEGFSSGPPRRRERPNVPHGTGWSGKCWGPSDVPRRGAASKPPARP